MFPLLQRIGRGFLSRFEGQPRSGQVLLWLLRGVFGAIVISMAMIAFRHFTDVTPNDPIQAYTSFFGILGLGFLLVLSDILIRDKQITTISAIYVGLLLGLLLGNILSTALEPFLFEWDAAKGAAPQSVKIFIEQGGKDARGHPQGPPRGPGAEPAQGHRDAAHHSAVLLHHDLDLAADQGRIPLHHPLRGVLQADQGKQTPRSRYQCHHRRPNCRYL